MREGKREADKGTGRKEIRKKGSRRGAGIRMETRK